MRARPILFSGAMVRALLDGSKTQTRRVIKPQPAEGESIFMMGLVTQSWIAGKVNDLNHPREVIPCPYGKPGDLLWVRETIAYQWPDDCDNGRVYPDDEGDDIREFGRPIKQAECDILYAATDLDAEWMGDNGEPCKPRWKPSIHMPRRASRITLEITGVRVEQLWEISEADAIAEGAEKLGYDENYNCFVRSDNGTHRTGFFGLWHYINGPESFEANPWLWVVEFKVHQRHVDEILRERGAA
jgi:hypothetical protein